MRDPLPTTFTDVSAAAANLPESVEICLPGGRQASVRRLSWIEFTQIWQELAALLSPLGPDHAPAAGEIGGVEAALAAAPALAGRLVELCAQLAEAELAALPYDDVLALAAAAVRLNFVDSAGLRDFFAACTAALSPPQGSGARS